MADKDRSILNYLSNSRLLFHGIEIFIGVKEMTIRAIDQNNIAMFRYAMSMYPSNVEEHFIRSYLHKNAIESKELFNTEMFRSEFESDSFLQWTSLSLYSNKCEYDLYLRGKNGLPYDLNNSPEEPIYRDSVTADLLSRSRTTNKESAADLLSRSRTTNKESAADLLSRSRTTTNESAADKQMKYSIDINIYLYGLIDGQHTDLFVKSFPEYNNINIIEHLVKHGTLKMLESRSKLDHSASRFYGIGPATAYSFKTGLGVMHLLSDMESNGKLDMTIVVIKAINENNIGLVESLIKDYKRIIQYGLKQKLCIPKSWKMIQLLRQHRCVIKPQLILLGGMTSGNYDMFFYGLDRMNRSLFNDSKIREALINATGYMIYLYFSKFRTHNSKKRTMIIRSTGKDQQQMYHHFHRSLLGLWFQEDDIYRYNIMKFCGYKVDQFHPIGFNYKPSLRSRSSTVSHSKIDTHICQKIESMIDTL